MNQINQSSVPGEVTIADRITFTIESLMSGENNQKIIENLKMYHDAGRGSRISIFHENIKNSEKILLMTKAVYHKMMSLTEKTSKTKKEYGFLVLGWVQDGNYLFDKMADDTDIDDETKKAIYDNNPNWESNDSAVDFNVLLLTFWQEIGSHIDRMKASRLKPLISLGHTHPNVSESYGNYSLPDLVGIAIQEEVIRGDRNNDELEYCHIVLPENGDVDCITFDKETGQFKKILDVISVEQNGENTIPAFTFESPKSLSTTSYVKEKDESEDDRLYNDCIEGILRKNKWDTIVG